MKPEPGSMSASDLARFLGIHVKTVGKRINSGRLPAPGLRVDGVRYWTPEQVREILSKLHR